jgi:hypothetical protein
MKPIKENIMSEANVMEVVTKEGEEVKHENE